MKVRIVASAPDGPEDKQYLTTFVIDDTIAIDAGCLGLYGEPQDQARVTDVFLTHTHADHVATLPVFVENTYADRAQVVTVHGHREALDSLHRDIFNDRVWPDFIAMRSKDQIPFMMLSELKAETPVTRNGLRVTPVMVNHVVPTFGYIVEDGTSAVIFGADSGPTDRLWELAADVKHLKAVFIESSFPDAMSDLAHVSAHLTPKLLAAEAAKLPAGVEVVAVHIKPRHREQTLAELAALDLPNLTIGAGGRVYEF
ncbi:MAG: MBL fold metallo-hydrolase [Planctomycetota bacterium]